MNKYDNETYCRERGGSISCVFVTVKAALLTRRREAGISWGERTFCVSALVASRTTTELPLPRYTLHTEPHTHTLTRATHTAARTLFGALPAPFWLASQH